MNLDSEIVSDGCVTKINYHGKQLTVTEPFTPMKRPIFEDGKIIHAALVESVIVEVDGFLKQSEVADDFLETCYYPIDDMAKFTKLVEETNKAPGPLRFHNDESKASLIGKYTAEHTQEYTLKSKTV